MNGAGKEKKALRESIRPSHCVVVLLDGLGDRSYPELGHKTPLQAARTPIMDELAARGTNGLFHAARPGVVLPSENAHFAMFGYSLEDFPGRGLLEALGAGIEVGTTDVALLAHFVSLVEKENTLILAEVRPPVAKEEADQLAAAVAQHPHDTITCRFTQTRNLDGIVSLSGDVTPYITDTDPLIAGQVLIEPQPLHHAAHDAQSKQSAQVLKSYLLWCKTVLEKHPVNQARIKQGKLPVNGLVTQRPGQWRDVEPFTKRWGLKGVSIASGLVYWGLSKFLGLNVHKVKDSADPGEDLYERLCWVDEHKEAFDFFHVHTKAPDAAAHTKNPLNKVAAIESLDKGLEKIVEKFLNDETILVVTSDHSTPSIGPQVHSGELVPIMVNGPGMRRDGVSTFDEVCCTCGCLGQLQGQDFMPCVLNWLDKGKLQGLMDTPNDQPYWPGNRIPFSIK